MQIIKRNGQIVDFDQNKIINAIQKANQEVPETARLSERWILAIADDVVEMCEERPDIVSVEEVQDMVQNSLIKHGAALVASILNLLFGAKPLHVHTPPPNHVPSFNLL